MKFLHDTAVTADCKTDDLAKDLLKEEREKNQINETFVCKKNE